MTDADASAPDAFRDIVGDGPRSPRAPLPDRVPGSGTLDRLADAAGGYACGAVPAKTLSAFGDDWTDWDRWYRSHGAAPVPPAPQIVGLYITELAASAGARRGRSRASVSVPSIERRLSGIAWD